MRIFNTSFASEAALSELAHVCFYVPLMLHELNMNASFNPEMYPFMTPIDEIYSQLQTKSQQRSWFNSNKKRWETAFLAYVNQLNSLLDMPSAEPVRVPRTLEQNAQTSSKIAGYINESCKILNLCLTLLMEIKAARWLWRQSMQNYISEINSYLSTYKPKIQEAGLDVSKELRPSAQSSSILSPGSDPQTVRFVQVSRKTYQSTLQAAARTGNMPTIKSTSGAMETAEHTLSTHATIKNYVEERAGEETPLLQWIDDFTQDFPLSLLDFNKCFELEVVNFDSRQISAENKLKLRRAFYWLCCQAEIDLVSDKISSDLENLINTHFSLEQPSETAAAAPNPSGLQQIINKLQTILGEAHTLALKSAISSRIIKARQYLVHHAKSFDQSSLEQSRLHKQALNKINAFYTAKTFVGEGKVKRWLNIITIFQSILDDLIGELDFIAVYLADTIIFPILKKVRPSLLNILKTDFYTETEWRFKAEHKEITEEIELAIQPTVAQQQTKGFSLFGKSAAPSATAIPISDEFEQKIRAFIGILKDLRTLANELKKFIPTNLTTVEEHNKLYDIMIKVTNGIAYGHKFAIHSGPGYYAEKLSSEPDHTPAKLKATQEDRLSLQRFEPVSSLVSKIMLYRNPQAAAGIYQQLVVICRMRLVKEPVDLAAATDFEKVPAFQLLNNIDNKFQAANALAEKHLPNLEPAYREFSSAAVA